jgi:hypothetical protein
MNYDVYKQAFDMVAAQNLLAFQALFPALLGMTVGVLGAAVTRKKGTIISILIGVALLGSSFVIGSTIHQNNLEQEAKETARFSSWIDKNYDLDLTKKETKQLEDGAVVKDYNGQLQKLTLEEYKDGVVVMNDGKAIKQK